MIIAVDARTIYARHRRGTGKNLVDVYRTLATVRSQWRFVMIHRGRFDDEPFDGLGNISTNVVDIRGDRWNTWEHIALPRAAWRARADVLHCPANSCPLWSPVPVVATVHDLIPLKISDPAEDEWRPQFERRVQRCVRRSRRVIAVSQCTKRDVISDLKGRAEAIDVITWAPDSTCLRIGDEAPLAVLKARYNIRDRYFIAVTGASRRKNAAGVISAFARLPEEIRSAVQLVLVGIEPAGARERVEAWTLKCGVAGQCLVKGFVPAADMPGLIKGADALLFCSRYEGFGLPVLDAFQCGTAVVCSNTSSIPEVAGDAALYCDPENPRDIAEAMTKVFADDVRRRDLESRGMRRVKMFTWQHTAEQLAAVFERCVSRGRDHRSMEPCIEAQV